MKPILIPWFLMAVLCGCQSKSKTVCFIAPDGFEGVFRVVEDRNGSNDPTSHGGATFYKFGGNRTIVASNTKALEEWHVLELRYASGKIVNAFVNKENLDDRKVVRDLFATAEGEFYFYIGPEDGVDVARENATELVKRPIAQTNRPARP